MFNAFTVNDLALVDQKPANSAGKTLAEFQTLLNDTNSTGRPIRSRSGCGECRRRKLGIECVWRQPGTERKNAKRRQSQAIKVRLSSVEETSGVSTTHTLIDTLRTNLQTSFDYEPQMNVFSLPFIRHLSETESRYLDYYINYVSSTLSLLPQETNYLLSLYIPLAVHNKAIMSGLIGWSGLFLAGTKSEETPMKYIQNAVDLCDKTLKSDELTISDKLELVCVFFILCAAEICVGDVKNWYDIFGRLHKFILDECNGNLKTLLGLLGDTEGAKWLLSNFLYHDVLSSSSHEEGTLFPIDQYCEALDIIPGTTQLMDSGTVCDPLQGCVRPMYVLLGQIINTKNKLDKMQEDLNAIEDRDSYKQKKFEFLTALEMDFEELETRIKNTNPHTPSLLLLKDDKELEDHLTLFETYKLSLRIYLRYMVRKTPPAVPEIQLMLQELTLCMDVIMDTNVQSGLCFALMVAGMSCVDPVDRDQMEARLRSFCSKFPVKNFELVLILIRKAWELNEDGAHCVNWFDISESMGWYLSLA
ncbi:hypothetical protein KL918_000593 [Ogataea parapolymorpha]|nr:hypothetical protein KL918_000593 [Ogataea parapolymorpha]KAG7875902.1 hypothetical protein KL916_000573 [Ogataea parapolymorpha]